LDELDKLPSNRYIYPIMEPRAGLSLEGSRVKQPADHVTLSSEEGERLMAYVHQSH
jgi:hypothetical protein